MTVFHTKISTKSRIELYPGYNLALSLLERLVTTFTCLFEIQHRDYVLPSYVTIITACISPHPLRVYDWWTEY